MKSLKRQMMEGTELPNQGKIRTLEGKETYKYLGILEAVEIKEHFFLKRILQENEKTTQSQIK